MFNIPSGMTNGHVASLYSSVDRMDNLQQAVQRPYQERNFKRFHILQMSRYGPHIRILILIVRYILKPI